MKKFINTVDSIVNDTIEGFISAYEDKVVKVTRDNVIARKEKKEKGKVGVVIGNGSGHEPACIGFVGKGMLDCNAYGGVFAAPGPMTLLTAIEEADNGAGVLVLISNHAGDVINSKMAIDMAEDDDIKVDGVILYDDMLSAPKADIKERRGTAGTLFSYKIAGSAAESGLALEEVKRITEKVRDNTRTITVASIPGISPITGKEMFEIGEDEVQMGVGVHGEAAVHTMKLTSAKEVAGFMTEQLVKDGELKAGDKVAVLVNGCGQTTYMEQLIFYKEVKEALEQKGIKTYKPAIGSFITTQEMGGIALAFCKMDDELMPLWDMETNTPAFPW